MAKKPATIQELVDSWTRKSGDNLRLYDKLNLLALLNNELYSQYQPFAIKPDYMDRLFTWVNGASKTSEQKLLFELATWLLFVGQEEMKTLYKSSFTGIIAPWVIDQADIPIMDDNAGDLIDQEIKKTFFGSIAGMDMGTYCRVNGIEGQSFRPDFREHAYLGYPRSLRRYLKCKGYQRIVAVEDYVGTGSQMREACNYLSELFDYPVLLCPMLIALKGVETGVELASKHTRFTFKPLYPLPEQAAVSAIKTVRVGNQNFLSKLRRLLTVLWPKVKGEYPTQKLYDEFGFGGTGSLLLTYLNCPDNVPPIIHHQSDTWKPLFQRASREG